MTTQITPEQSSNAIRMLRECGDFHSAAIIGSLADQVEALTSERNGWIGRELTHHMVRANLEDERDALKADAARYRHVRGNPAMLLHLSNLEFDAAIDAAMAVQS